MSGRKTVWSLRRRVAKIGNNAQVRPRLLTKLSALASPCSPVNSPLVCRIFILQTDSRAKQTFDENCPKTYYDAQGEICV